MLTATEDEVLAFLYLPIISKLSHHKLEELDSQQDTQNLCCDIVNLAQSSLQEQKISRPKIESSDTPKRLLSKCKAFISHNQVGMAVQRLESWSTKERPVDIQDPGILDELQELHPAASIKDKIELPTAPIHDIELEPKDIAEMISKLPSESGTSIFPWTNEAIKSMFKNSEEFRTATKSFLHAMVNGKLCHSNHWLTSKIVAIRKPNGKLRPIAISDPWIRLGSKLLVNYALPKCQTFLGPHQMGIGKSGGADVIIHTSQLVASHIKSNKNSNYCMLAMDCKNAFNSIRRGHISNAINSVCPNLISYFTWAYEKPVELKSSFHSTPILSSTGVRQGDPLGPLLFSLGVARALDRVRNIHRHVVVQAYLDDVFIYGTVSDCISTAKLLKYHFVQLGLHFNDNKCNMLGAADSPQEHTFNKVNGINVLGIPVGSSEFINEHLQSLLKDQTKILDMIGELESSEAFGILRAAINARPVHTVRGLHPSTTLEYARNFDQLVASALSRIVMTGELPADSLSVKSLSTHLGGIGIKDLARCRNGAWAASWLKALQYIHTHLNDKIFWMTEDFDFHPEIIYQLPLPHPVGNALSFKDLVLPIVLAEDPIPRQKDLNATIDTTIYEDLLDTLKLSRPEAAALLVSASVPGISSWLNCCTNPNPSLRLCDDSFRESLRIRMLLPIHEDPVRAQRRCTSCNIHDIEVEYHGLSCRGPSDHRRRRHDMVVSALCDFIRAAVPSARVHKEVDIEANTRTSGGPVSLRCDIKMTVNHSTHYLDVAITNPCGPTFLKLNRKWEPAFAAAYLENKKIDKYSKRHGESVGKALIPFGIECTGRLGPHATEFVEKLSGLQSIFTIGDDKLKKAREEFKKKMMIILCNGNAKLVSTYRNWVRDVKN